LTPRARQDEINPQSNRHFSTKDGTISEALQAQIIALETQRDEEIRAVLSPDQQRRLDARIAEAQAKKEAKAEKKAAEKKRNIQQVKKAG
jgi:hypothetical protein